jgi:hypothetical protein
VTLLIVSVLLSLVTLTVLTPNADKAANGASIVGDAVLLLLLLVVVVVVVVVVVGADVVLRMGLLILL